MYCFFFKIKTKFYTILHPSHRTKTMIKTLFAILILVTTLIVAEGQCTANVMVSEIDSEGQSGTERMKLANIEVNSAETAYVRLTMCPQGHAVPQAKMIIPCTGTGCSGTAGMYKTSIPPRTNYSTITNF